MVSFVELKNRLKTPAAFFLRPHLILVGGWSGVVFIVFFFLFSSGGLAGAVAGYKFDLLWSTSNLYREGISCDFATTNREPMKFFEFHGS